MASSDCRHPRCLSITLHQICEYAKKVLAKKIHCWHELLQRKRKLSPHARHFLENKISYIYDVYSGVRALKWIQRNNVASTPIEFPNPHIAEPHIVRSVGCHVRMATASKIFETIFPLGSITMRFGMWHIQNAHISRKLEKMTSISTIESGMRWSEQHVVS